MSDTNLNSEAVEPTHTSSKDLGNEAFAHDDYETAIKHWKDALRSVEYCLKKGLFDDCKDKQAEIDAMNLNILSNICMGYLKLRQWSPCIEFGNRALAVDKYNLKVLYRIAEAQFGACDYQNCEETVFRFELAGGAESLVKNFRLKLRKGTRDYKTRSKLVSRAMLASEPDPFWRKVWNAVVYVLRCRCARR
ncbi:MAG: uncharacterized protein KVP18_004655 [Porospora cf. gigantea A]|uniref:uncharacterized protein n=1 Tax=Porospora cf. gigantea A TaxID=2853593 RepID=UPI0035598F6B|nr:MAG: hypothetical protein KVP18_004655 [Porospora cf. gigantea A]